MKLAVAVVYIVAEGREKLLALHLDRIARHTSVPYAIHAGVNRLEPSHRALLGSRAAVRQHDLPPTDARGAEEHSHYLEQLVRIAIEDGATHVVTLHVDSFPIADGWAERLAGEVGGPCAFATVEGLNTSCLFFPREFYLGQQPRFLVPAAVQRSADYDAFVRETGAIEHSGIGYGWAAWQSGRRWYSMAETAHSDDENRTTVHDDLVFHLRGAVRLAPFAARDAPPRRMPRAFSRAEALVRWMLPAAVRRRLRGSFSPLLERSVDRLRSSAAAPAMQSIADQLLAHPDEFVEAFRRSRKP